MNYLLDTCVISELRAQQPNVNVVQWIDEVSEESLFLSVITIGEIKRGIEKLPKGAKKQELASWLEEKLLARFKNRVLPINIGVMLTWGAMVARLEQKGRKLPGIDSLVAAIALFFKMSLVTRNEKDFHETGVMIVNPWPKK